MSHSFPRLAAAVLAAGLLAAPSPAAPPAAPEADLVDTAVAAGDFQVLTSALKAAGLVDALRAEGPFTVFAPSDAAFRKLPAGTVETLLKAGNRARLGAILGFHVVAGRLDAAALARGGEVTALNGQPLHPGLRDGRLTVDGAVVLRAGIECRNGVIHVIDRVLMPETRTLAERLAADGRFKTLLAAAQAAGLTGALAGEGPLTVFAPTDAAFAALPTGTVDALLQPGRKADLLRILTYHVVSGRVAAADALKGGTAETLEGSPLALTLVDGALRIDGAGVVEADIEASNGIVHAVDTVLMPPSVARDPARVAEDLLLLAIERGVPIFNRGDEDACAAIYEVAVRAVAELGGDAVPVGIRADLNRTLERARTGRDAGARAWELRRAMDRALNELMRNREKAETAARPGKTMKNEAKAADAFRPLIEAPLPEGFPAPGPVGEVVAKAYPVYRAAQAQGGGNSFWTLFQHIKKNDIAMTAPVEMAMEETDAGGGLAVTGMAFLYQSAKQGEAGRAGDVEVVDLPRATVLSFGMRGPITPDKVREAKASIERDLQTRGWTRAGDWRLMGYNSPMVPEANRFYEIQLPARPASE